jgi:hypothetical protein
MYGMVQCSGYFIRQLEDYPDHKSSPLTCRERVDTEGEVLS